MSATNDTKRDPNESEGLLARFHPRHLPFMSRTAYVNEILSWAFLPFFLGAIEGGTLGVVVKKTFTGVADISPIELNLAVALVTAAPNVANLSSFMWAAHSQGKPKVAYIATLQTMTAVCVAAIAAMPEQRWGLWTLCLLATLARITWTGVITLRSAVWRANYPREIRAKIAGNMATVQSLVLALCGWAIGAAMDFSPMSFHFLFPALALLGIAGNVLWRRVPMRGERRLLRAELAAPRRDGPQINPVSVLRVLKQDRAYAKFMLWMSVFGLGNLMVSAPLAIVLEEELNATYAQGILVTTVIPLLVMPLAIPFWARMLDRSHVVDFRAIHAWSFVTAAGLVFVAAIAKSMTIFYVSGLFLGIGFAGGSLAWNIGHQDFAPPERDAEYMGVHVTLNGIRGLIAPFLAVGLYEWLKGMHAGSWAFFVCFVVNAIGAWGFVAMRRDRKRHRKATLVSDSQPRPLPQA
ncbi:MAG: MFS transporter [Planctomycetes bacterium]|nr:MFS transporter [Planctomycetota bacterium]